jgi:ketosteroid isomerase-like protein
MNQKDRVMQVKELWSRGIKAPDIAIRCHMYLDDVVYIINHFLV